jgi:hypothetical protein
MGVLRSGLPALSPGGDGVAVKPSRGRAFTRVARPLHRRCVGRFDPLAVRPPSFRDRNHAPGGRPSASNPLKGQERFFQRRKPMRQATNARRALALPALPLLACLACANAQAADIHRKVPDGTLTYHIELDGHGTYSRDGTNSTSTYHRAVDASTRMHGNVVTGHSAPGASQLPTMASLEKQAEACNDDQACMMAIARKMMQSPQMRAGFQSDGDKIVASLGRDTAWGQSDHCSVHGLVDDRETVHGHAVGEGISEEFTVHGTRQGKAGEDCTLVPGKQSPADDATLLVDGARNTYEVHLPGFEVRSTTKFDDNVQRQPDVVRIPAVDIKDLKYAPGKALEGQRDYKAMMVVRDTPFGLGVQVPLHAKVTWKFVPDGG